MTSGHHNTIAVGAQLATVGDGQCGKPPNRSKKEKLPLPTSKIIVTNRRKKGKPLHVIGGVRLFFSVASFGWSVGRAVLVSVVKTVGPAGGSLRKMVFCAF